MILNILRIDLIEYQMGTQFSYFIRAYDWIL